VKSEVLVTTRIIGAHEFVQEKKEEREQGKWL